LEASSAFGLRSSVVGHSQGGAMASYRDLRVWQQAMDLAEEVYKATEIFPKHELYGLVSQIRRAAVSVASNIAEGKGRQTDKDFVNFLYHSRGSLLEIETQICLARRLKYLSPESEEAILERTKSVGQLLAGLIHSLSGTDAEGAAAK
jgi:four helix bundle protein